MTETAEKYGYPFQLRPFAPALGSRGLTLGGSLYRLPGVLSIEYRLEGDLRSVVWPTPCLVLSRRHELWRQTCFELFLGIAGESPYWEVNLGPDGGWNLYHFTAYRQGMQEDSAVDELTSHVVRDGNGLSLFCRIDMHKLVPDCQALEVGIAGVLLAATGAATYWAIDHFETVPDCHCRRSFLMALPGLAKM